MVSESVANVSNNAPLLQVTVKGSRSEVKAYTDVCVVVKGVDGGFSVGLTPTIGLVCFSTICVLSLIDG